MLPRRICYNPISRPAVNTKSQGEIPISNKSVSNPSEEDLLNMPDTDEDWAGFLASVDALYGEEAPEAPAPAQEKPKAEPPRKSKSHPKKRRKSFLPMLLSVLLIAVLAAGVLLFVLPQLSGGSSELVPAGITAAGVDIGGMRKKEAVKAIQTALGDKIAKNDMEVTLPDGTVTLTPKQSGAALDVQALVNAAMLLVPEGNEGIALGADSFLTLNEEAIRSLLAEHTDPLSEGYTPSGFSLDGDMPALDEEHFNPDAPCPTLTLRTGTPGVEMDMDTMVKTIREAYLAGSFHVDLSGAANELTPEALDLNAVREQVAAAPVNGSFDPKTNTVTPGSYGLDFDVEAAQKLLDAAKPGQTVEIPMEYVTPDIIGQEVYFQDILGFCQTPHGNNEQRTTNLKLACATLNGVVIQPGEVLSYNDTLGQRTAENGYQPAPAYSGTKLVNTIGGGICQVSSTLYLSSLYAEFEPVDRVSHGYPANYMPVGLDATVSWGTPDLKIRNTSEFPVKIVAEEADGFVRIWLMGTEVRDYYVRMGYTASGHYAKSYTVKYDRETGEKISREACQLSSYFTDDMNVVGEIGPEEAYVNGNVRVQDPCSPTPETLEASKNYSTVNKNAE